MEVAWQMENDPDACLVLDQQWPHVKNLGDVTKVVDPEPVDLLCGGFPCQDVSKANPERRGLAGDRSSLFFSFWSLADMLQPDWVLIENVPGLLTSNDGRDFLAIQDHLAEVGYEDIAWRVLDSRGWGTPQRRQRLFVVGHLGSRPGTFARAVLDDRRAGGEGPDPHLPPRAEPSGASGAGVAFRKSRRPRNSADYETWVDDGWANCLNLFDGGASRPTHLVVLPDGRLRILTPREHERLQGFPPDWTVAVSSERKREALCGNAVTVPVARWLGDRIMTIHELGAF